MSDPMEVVVDGVDDSYTNSGKGKPLQQGQQLLRSTKMRFNSNMKGGESLYKWMDRWMVGWMDRWMNG